MTYALSLDWVFIAGFACLLLVPFDPSRVRQRWAKLLFLLCGLLGLLKGLGGLAFDMDWFTLSVPATTAFHTMNYQLSGLLLGILLALVFSGQLWGKRPAPGLEGNFPWSTHRGLFLGIVMATWFVLVLVGWVATRPARFDNLQIRGAPRFKHQVLSALALLKARAPDAYQLVTNYIGVIAQAKHSGMAAYKNPPTFELNPRSAFYSLTWCAASIAHDSLHSKLYHEYLQQHPGESVPDEVWGGEKVERQCSQHESNVLKEIGAPSAEVLWSSETNNRYWEVDYNKRDW